jgi:hypothetical protein
MEKLIDALLEQCKIIEENADKVKAGNKAAAKRIRKATTEIGNRIGKEFRKRSVSEM